MPKTLKARSGCQIGHDHPHSMVDEAAAARRARDAVWDAGRSAGFGGTAEAIQTRHGSRRSRTPGATSAPGKPGGRPWPKGDRRADRPRISSASIYEACRSPREPPQPECARKPIYRPKAARSAAAPSRGARNGPREGAEVVYCSERCRRFGRPSTATAPDANEGAASGALRQQLTHRRCSAIYSEMVCRKLPSSPARSRATRYAEDVSSVAARRRPMASTGRSLLQPLAGGRHSVCCRACEGRRILAKQFPVATGSSDGR
jgi:hypothetical protein